MAELTNEFSWSKTRHETFGECRRKYFYHYYGSWGGWDASAPEEARLLYRLKQIKNLDLQTGTAVHVAIEETLREIRAGRTPSPAAARERVRALLNEAWMQSREKLWRRDPKRAVNLFEHYYGPPPTSQRIDRIRAKAFACVDQFFRLPWYGFIRYTPARDFLSLEDLDAFDLDGVRVFVKPDFAMRRDGAYYLFDWKTGKATERDTLQLACYAASGVHRWEVAPEAIRIVIAYLGDGSAEERTITASEVDEARRFIADSIASMRACLADPKTNLARIEEFPRIEDRRVCARCVFRQACRPDETF